MSNQRTSSFKKKTTTDSKQDSDISTIQSSLNNITVPTKSTKIYYVDGSSGTDTNDGSRERPFKTVQKGINQIETVYDGTTRELKILSGTYNETLTIKKPYIQITGSSTSRYCNSGCILQSFIYIQVATGTDINAQISIIGCQIKGQVADTSSNTHTLNIKDCLFNYISTTLRQASTADCLTYLEDVNFIPSDLLGATYLVSIEKGTLEMTNCTLIAKSYACSCLVLAKLNKATIKNCTFSNTDTGLYLKPLITCNNLTTQDWISFHSCHFSTVAGASNRVTTFDYNSAIYNTQRMNVLVNKCFFKMLGLPNSGTNYIILSKYDDPDYIYWDSYNHVYITSSSLTVEQSSNIAFHGTCGTICPLGSFKMGFQAVA